MKNPFKRKQCKQCGGDLGIFSKKIFCSEQCASIWDQGKRARNKKMLGDLDKIREIRERQKYEELKSKFKDERGITLTEEQLEKLLKDR